MTVEIERNLKSIKKFYPTIYYNHYGCVYEILNHFQNHDLHNLEKLIDSDDIKLKDKYFFFVRYVFDRQRNEKIVEDLTNKIIPFLREGLQNVELINKSISKALNCIKEYKSKETTFDYIQDLYDSTFSSELKMEVQSVQITTEQVIAIVNDTIEVNEKYFDNKLENSLDLRNYFKIICNYNSTNCKMILT